MKITNKIIGLAAFIAVGLTGSAIAAGGGAHIDSQDWSFEGPTGTYDKAALQRGFQVYKEVCSACHGLKFVAFRSLMDEHGPAFEEAQVKAFAADFEVIDNGDEAELGDTKSAELFDRFPVPSATGNPPDLSLMAKARPDGANYIYSLLTNYTGEETVVAGNTLYGNVSFPGGQIGMAPPLADDLVEYQDGTTASLEQMSRDVTHFLMWSAEPKLEQRKSAGIRNILYMLLFAGMLYLCTKKIWAPIKRND